MLPETPGAHRQIRSLETLLQDFQASAGSFLLFHQSLKPKERTLWSHWLETLRSVPPSNPADLC